MSTNGSYHPPANDAAKTWTEILCDDNAGVITQFQRCYSSTLGVVTSVDLDLAGAAYTPTGTVGTCSDPNAAMATVPNGATLSGASVLPTLAPSAWTFEVLAIEDGVIQIDFDNLTTAERSTITELLDDVQNVEEGYYEPTPGTFRHTQSTQYITSDDSVMVWIDTNKRLADWAQAVDPGLQASGDSEVTLFLTILGTGPQPGAGFGGNLFSALPVNASVPLVATYAVEDPSKKLEDVAPTCAVPDGCSLGTPVAAPWPGSGTGMGYIIDIVDGVIQSQQTGMTQATINTYRDIFDSFQSVEEGFVTFGGTNFLHTQAISYNIDSDGTMTTWTDTNKRLADWASTCDPGLEASGDAQLATAEVDGPLLITGGSAVTITEVLPTTVEAPLVAAYVKYEDDPFRQQIPVDNCDVLVNCDINCFGSDTISVAASYGCTGGNDVEVGLVGNNYSIDFVSAGPSTLWSTNFVTAYNTGTQQLCWNYESTLTGTTASFNFFGPGVNADAVLSGAGVCNVISLTYNPQATIDWLIGQGCSLTDPAVVDQQNMIAALNAIITNTGDDYDPLTPNAETIERQILELTFDVRSADAVVAKICNADELAQAIEDARAVETCPVPVGCTVGTPVNLTFTVNANDFESSTVDVQNGIGQFEYTNGTSPAAMAQVIASLDAIQNVEYGWVDFGGLFIHSQGITYHQHSEDALTLWADTNKRLPDWAAACDPGLEAAGTAAVTAWSPGVGQNSGPIGVITLTLTEILPINIEVPLTASYIKNLDDSVVNRQTETCSVPVNCSILPSVTFPWPATGSFISQTISIKDGVGTIIYTELDPADMNTIVTTLDAIQDIDYGYIQPFPGFFQSIDSLQYHAISEDTLILYIDSNAALPSWAESCDPGLALSGNGILSSWTNELTLGQIPGQAITAEVFEITPEFIDVPLVATVACNPDGTPFKNDIRVPIHECPSFRCRINCNNQANTGLVGTFTGCTGGNDVLVAGTPTTGYTVTFTHDDTAWGNQWVNDFNSGTGVCWSYPSQLLPQTGGVNVDFSFFGLGLGVASQAGVPGCHTITFTYDPLLTRDWLLTNQRCSDDSPAVATQDRALSDLQLLSSATFDNYEANSATPFLTRAEPELITDLVSVDSVRTYMCNTDELAGDIAARIITAPELLCVSFDGGTTYENGVATSNGWFQITDAGLVPVSEAVYDPTGCNCPCDDCIPNAALRCNTYGRSFLGAGNKFPAEVGFTQGDYNANALNVGCPVGPPNNLFFRVLAWEIDGTDYAPNVWVNLNDVASLETYLNSITPGSIAFTLDINTLPNVQIDYPDSVPVRIVIEDTYDDGTGLPCPSTGFGWVLEHDGTPSGAIVDTAIIGASVTPAATLADAAIGTFAATGCVAI